MKRSLPIMLGSPVFVSCLLAIVCTIPIDLFAPSLPNIIDKLHMSQGSARGIVVVYLFGLAFSQLLYGPWSDIVGRKPILLMSLALNILSSGLSVYVTNGHQLLICRFVAGIGAGSGPVMARAILRDSFSDAASLTRAFSVMVMTAMLSPSLAPIVGGFMQQFYGWRTNFLLLTLFCLVVWMLIAFFFKETRQRQPSRSVMQVVNQYATISRHREFIIYGILAALNYTYLVSYCTITPFILQLYYHVSPLVNGMIYIFFAAGIFLGAMLVRRLSHYYAGERILRYAIVLFIVLSIFMFVSAHYFGLVMMIVLSSLIALLNGVVSPLCMALAMMNFKTQAGTASALQGCLKMAGAAAMSALLLGLTVTTEKELALSFLSVSLVSFVLSRWLFSKVR